MSNVSCVQNGTNEVLSAQNIAMRSVNVDSRSSITYYKSEVENYKTQFNSWSKKTAQSTLEMCRVVAEAKKMLNQRDFGYFCFDIGHNGEDATIRKYLKIGSKYDQLFQYAELLPSSWTSIYQITQLPADVFDALASTDNTMANITGDKLRELMGKTPQGKTESSAVVPYILKVRFKSKPSDATIDLLKEGLSKIKESFGIEFEIVT